jgi:hydrogenase expression/formation protein HypD
MSALIDEGVEIDGYIAPGHVSTVTGSSIYQDIPNKYGLAVVISGFEPVDILQSILMLVNQIEQNDPKVEIQYSRVVKPEGNPKALSMLEQVFELTDDWWRGLGLLPNSGMKIKKEYSKFDAEANIPVIPEKTVEPKGCICGEILKGIKTPKDCNIFGTICTPSDPVGACMVSNEGACAAYYKYSK